MNHKTLTPDQLRNMFGHNFNVTRDDVKQEANNKAVAKLLGLDTCYELPFTSHDIVDKFLYNYPSNIAYSVRECVGPKDTLNEFENEFVEQFDAETEALNRVQKSLAYVQSNFMVMPLHYWFYSAVNALGLLDARKSQKVNAIRKFVKLVKDTKNVTPVVPFIPLKERFIPKSTPDLGDLFWVADLNTHHDGTPPTLVSCEVDGLTCYDFGNEVDESDTFYHEDGSSDTFIHMSSPSVLSIDVHLKNLEENPQWNWAGFRLDNSRIFELETKGFTVYKEYNSVLYKNQEDAIKAVLDATKEQQQILNDSADNLKKLQSSLENKQ